MYGFMAESNTCLRQFAVLILILYGRGFTITSDQYFISDPQGTLAYWEEIRTLQWIAFHPGSDGSEFWQDVRLEGVTLMN